jgi:dynein heavy chain
MVMKAHIDDLNLTIKVGFYPLNWTSQRIPAYIEELDMALVRFKSTISQLHKNAAMIEDVVQSISQTLLVQMKDFKSPQSGQLEPMDVSEFYDIMEARRSARLDSLVQEYRSIGDSFLMKVEEVVAKTATGCSPVLFPYYSFWERKLYNAIVTMLLSSMSVFMGMLQCKDTAPLFKLTVALNGKDLSVNPSLTDIDKFIAKGMRSIAESSKVFVRWMHGTCIKTEPQVLHEDDEPYIFSFYQDISQNPEIVKLTLSVTSQTNRVFNLTNKYLDGWRRYDKVHNLWNPKRKQQVEKAGGNCSYLDQAMGSFHITGKNLESQPTLKEIEFLQIDVALVAMGVIKQAEVWKNDYGEALYNYSSALPQTGSSLLLSGRKHRVRHL